MKVLVTGAAGFIGFHLSKALVENNIDVVGLDNINDYYDISLKFDRLKQLGIHPDSARIFNQKCKSTVYPDRFSFVRMKLEDREELPELFKSEKIDVVCNLAAQAGVRYSLENPFAYIESNTVGFLNLLECCRHHHISRLVYASSSSVYGTNESIPFSVKDRTDKPISLYAATKLSNEIMAYTYSHLYQINTIGLRFFTVYGPWGRPDMALFLFTRAILNDKKIDVYNHGIMERDFTYIDDIIEGVQRIICKANPQEKVECSLYNIGNSKSVKLMDFIQCIEQSLGKKAQMNMLPMQPGDVPKTWANVDDLIKDYDYRPNTPIDIGVKRFTDWYTSYYGNKA